MAYPLLVLAPFAWLISNFDADNTGLLIAFAYVSLLSTGVLEWVQPYCRDWRRSHGDLRADLDWHDVLRAAFPAGTLTGAPKIRAMQIIDELEPTRRGVYGGAVGYISYTGNMDLAIAIRTLVTRGDTIHVGVGAGIVADSDASAEYEETLNKARAVLRAVALARGT